MAKNISGLTLELEQGTTNLWARWSNAQVKKYKSVTNGKTGKNKKVYYKFKEYKVTWKYQTAESKKSNKWYVGAENSVSNWGTLQNSYGYPENAVVVKVFVKFVLEKGTKTPPSFATISKSVTIKGIDVPATPSAPTISTEYNGDVSISTTIPLAEIRSGVDYVMYQLEKGYSRHDSSTEIWTMVYNKVKVRVTESRNTAILRKSLDEGYYWHVRAIAYNSTSKKESTPTDYSNKFYTHAGKPYDVAVESITSTMVKISFKVLGYVEELEVEYCTEAKRYLGSNSQFTFKESWTRDVSANTEVRVHILANTISNNIQPGHNYWFRVRAKSGSYGVSSWSDVVSLSVGRVPGPPSTYSSKTAAEIGETVTLYWVHNSQDESSQTKAQIELYINNDELLGNATVDVDNIYIDDEYQKDKTLSLEIPLTSNSQYDPKHPEKTYDFKDGDILYWRVRTKGAYTPPATIDKRTQRFYKKYTPGNIITCVVDYTVNDVGTSIISDDAGNVITIEPEMSAFVGNTGRSIRFDLDSLDDNPWSENEETYLNIEINYTSVATGYGDWSALKQISMYQRPSASILLKTGWDIDEGVDSVSPTNIIDSYPLAVIMSASPDSQQAISFSLIISNAGEKYETKNEYGEDITIGQNEILYQSFFDINELDLDENNERTNQKTLILYPSDVIFNDGQSYNFNLEAYMSSGLIAEAELTDILASLDESVDFSVVSIVEPDPDSLTATIQVSCYDDDPSAVDDLDPSGEYSLDEIDSGSLTQNVLMDVYRIETDGSVTLIKRGIPNNGGATVVDPYPSLDYARYRIVARKQTTAQADYQDNIGEEMGVHSLVIQWDEVGVDAFNYRDADDESDDIDALIGEPHSTEGRLVLPWNVDTSEDFKPDVSAISYIGRSHPVTYYGTQKGHTASWSTTIDKTDNVTLFKLRKLANYMGDVYVREPFGTGYWANVQVNWSQTHNEPSIPVSINVTRVEGALSDIDYQEEGGDESA